MTRSHMSTVTVQQLREIVCEILKGSIGLHRLSREASEQAYVMPTGKEPTDEEIDDFLHCNPLLNGETVTQLTDPGLLGFFARTADASEEWLEEFRENVSSWAGTREWHAADLVPYHVLAMFDDPIPTRELWTPSSNAVPLSAFISGSPSHLLLADKLLREGRLLSDLHWRDFEKLIAELLETHGWTVKLMQGTKDGGIDVLSERTDQVLGPIKAVWQAKKYRADHKVQLSHLRELSAVVDRSRFTKGIIVTTSSLTRGALDWIARDEYRLDAKDGRYVEWWVKQRLGEI